MLYVLDDQIGFVEMTGKSRMTFLMKGMTFSYVGNNWEGGQLMSLSISQISVLLGSLVAISTILNVLQSSIDNGVLWTKDGCYKDEDLKKYKIQIYAVIVLYILGIGMLVWGIPLQIASDDQYYVHYRIFSMVFALIAFLAFLWMIKKAEFKKAIEFQWVWITRIYFVVLMIGTTIEQVLYGKLANYYIVYLGITFLAADLIFVHNLYYMISKVIKRAKKIDVVFDNECQLENVVEYSIVKDMYIITIGDEKKFEKIMVDKGKVKEIHKYFGEYENLKK